MERLYAQFEGNVWIDLMQVVGRCREAFVYGSAVHVRDGEALPFGGTGQLVRSLLVTFDAENRVYDAVIWTGSGTYRALQVVADRDGALARLLERLA